MFDDKMHEECGIVGMYHSENCVETIATALHSLQHRGQESSGIAASNGENIKLYRKIGLVSTLAQKMIRFKDFSGSISIGHTRYSTTGTTTILNSQPILIDYKMGQLAVAHNGNLTNAQELRNNMEMSGSIFHSTNDSEVILHLISKSKKAKIHEMIMDSLNKVKGAFSLLFLTKDSLIAARDPFGVRPLCLGKYKNSYIVASETCAFDIIGANYIRDVEPGEILVIKGTNLESFFLNRGKKKAHCIFEFIYFARPDSKIFGQNVDKLRRAFGKELAKESQPDADIVIAVPDSSNTAALGYSQQSSISFELGLIRNHYVGRTFISPYQKDRSLKVKLKFNPVKGVLKNKRVVVVEDSIVRGTTLKQLVKLIRAAGAKEIHVRVSSPPIKFPCFYGMDFPSKAELIATNKTIEQTRKYLEVDSLYHLTLSGLQKCVGDDHKNYCYACFSGKYPINKKSKACKHIFERQVS